MIWELTGQQKSGLLGYHTRWGGRNIELIQSWNSFEELRDYARIQDAQHLPADWERAGVMIPRSMNRERGKPVIIKSRYPIPFPGTGWLHINCSLILLMQVNIMLRIGNIEPFFFECIVHFLIHPEIHTPVIGGVYPGPDRKINGTVG